MKNPNPNMLVRIAQGDSYGMACEYIKLPRDKGVYDAALAFKHYCEHPTHALKAGQYTDDTQMSIAVAEVLLKQHFIFDVAFHEPMIKQWFTESFFNCFKRDPRDGYSRNFQALLEKVKSADELAKELKPNSDKNGAAMRSVPIGVLPTPQEVMDVANVQAKITHDTVGGRQSSILVAMMSHYALYTDRPFKDFPDWIVHYTEFVPREWNGEPVMGEGVGMKTADAVFTLLSTKTSLIDIARQTIKWGGDTDSVLAIAWGIASARMKEDLPPFFDGGLENGPYGHRFLFNLGRDLMDSRSRALSERPSRAPSQA
jgi:ADP-ribosyl-[dinitrogen reductase] hydrolase